MSIAIRVQKDGRDLTRYAGAINMADALAYLRGWVAPAPLTSAITVLIESASEQRRYALRVNGRHISLLPCNR
jgi:hypothetical protein